MSRRDIKAKKRRQLRDGRLWETRWIRAGRPRGMGQPFRESVDGSGLRRRKMRAFGTTGIEAAAVFHEAYARLTAR
jgi:hypothetical protein